MGLCKVVEVNKLKCANCDTCISVCPIKYCFTSDGEFPTINDDLCIGCGRCYKACPHNAIEYKDDFQNFLDTLNRGEKISLVVSPAIKTAFKNQESKIISYIKQTWAIPYILDEGIGAELVVLKYKSFIKKTGFFPIISQQCPSIVEFIKIFAPHLIEYLAPLHSPAIVTAQLLKKNYNYEEHIAYLGPCLSKRREFKDPDTEGIIKFNITFESLKKHLDLFKIDLNDYQGIDYDYLTPEKGSVFCKPGGFKNIFERDETEKKLIRHYEGPFLYKTYFKELQKLIKENFANMPILFDVLNCEGGCYDGPCSINKLSYEEEISTIEKIESDAMKQFKDKVQKIFETLLTENRDVNFDRIYFSDSVKPIYTLPIENLMQEAIATNKHEEKDFLNCQSCGYETCRSFSTALHYKLTVPSKCRYYIENALKKSLKENNKISEEIVSTINQMEAVTNSIVGLSEKAKTAFEKIYANTEKTKDVNNNLKSDSDLLKPIVSAISEISEQINLLSLNAAIEASRAGDSGKGFAVVSTEIRKLADKTKNETFKIIPIMQTISNNVESMSINMDKLADDTKDFSEAIETLHSSMKEVNLAIKDLSNAADKLAALGQKEY